MCVCLYLYCYRYIWNTVYLGIRVMAEVGNVLGEYNESVG